MPRIFISYNHEDQQIALEIDQLLKKHGWDVWIDSGSLVGGDKYKREIKSSIPQCLACLVLVSRAAAESRWVGLEIDTAEEKNKPIIPIRIERDVSVSEVFDGTLAGLHYIDWTPPSSHQDLLNSLAKLKAAQRSRRTTLASLGTAGIVLLLWAGWLLFNWRQGNVFAEPPIVLAVPPIEESAQPAAASSLPREVVDKRRVEQPADSRQLRVPDPVQLPAEAAQLAALGPLQVAFLESPPEDAIPIAVAVKPALEFALFGQRQGEAGFSLMEDGHALTSSRDLYSVVARPQSAGWLYIFQVDSLGNVAWLYPKNSSCNFSSGENPVVAGDVVQMPPADAGEAFFLDDNVGAEQIFFVLTVRPWPKLADALHKASQQTGKTPVREALVKLDRGPGGTRKVEPLVVKRQQNNRTFDLQLQGLVHESDGSLLVRQRWFRHVE